MSDEDRKLSAEMAGMIGQTRQAIDRSKDMVELRKWCVERACELFPHCKDGDAKALEILFNKIHDFVRAPLDTALEKRQR